MASRRDPLAGWERWAGSRAILVEACIALCAAKLRLMVTPPGRVRRILGEPAPPLATHGPAPAAALRRTARVRWAVVAARARLPWRSSCLCAALAAARMLRRRNLPATLYLGVAREEGEALRAHAWLRSGELIVTGEPGMEDFAVIAGFVGGRRP